MRRSTHLLSSILVLSLTHLTTSIPLPPECACPHTPLSTSSFNYVSLITASRHLTPAECAFVCNPSPPAQTATEAISELKNRRDRASTTTAPSELAPLPRSPSFRDPVFEAESEAIRSSLAHREIAITAYAPSEPMELPPPLFDPAEPRPAPLFGAESLTPSDRPRPPPVQSAAESSEYDPDTYIPGSYTPAIAARPPPLPLVRIGIFESRVYGESGLGLAGGEGVLIYNLLRVTGSVVLLFVIAVCVVQIANGLVVCCVRRIRGRGFSGSGRLRLDEDRNEKWSSGGWSRALKSPLPQGWYGAGHMDM